MNQEPDYRWESADEIDLRHLWNVLYRSKWGILGSAAAVGLIAALLAFAMTPIYRASATLLIESEEANIVSIEEVYGLDTRRQEYFETQFEILRSRPLAEDVVETLSLVQHEEFMTAEDGPFLGLDWRAWLPFSVSSAPMETRAWDPQADAVDAYADRLTISPIGNTQLVEVRFESADRELAARVANEHARAYIESMLDARVDVTESAAQWMAERLEVMQQELLESERQLQEFREREELIDVEGLLALPSQEINDLSARLLEVRQTLASAEIAYLQVSQAGSTPDLRGIPAILEDPGVRRFQEIEAEARRNVAELAERYGPLHPNMIVAQAELVEATENLSNQRESVAEGIRNRYEAAQAEERSILAALDRARTQYQDLGRKESELRRLQRAVDTNRQLYELFYNRLSETSVAGDLQTPQARIVSPAVVPRSPAKPNKKLIVSLAVVLTLMLGVGLAFLLDALDNTVRTGADVEEKIRRPLLGTVPLLKPRALKAVSALSTDSKTKPDPSFEEAVRTVRTSISLDNLDNPHKAILITSSVSAEGKSTLALNLARTFAATERTLLLDADMRRPRLARMLDLPRNMPGLSELLAEKVRLKDCLAASAIENLEILATGFIPPDPLQLLSSPRMTQAIRVLGESYERIVIDAPPILAVSDAAVLSRLADSVVFVARADSTTVPQIRQGLDLLERVHAPITGVVLSQLDFRKAAKYGDYGYGGYYGAYAAQ